MILILKLWPGAWLVIWCQCHYLLINECIKKYKFKILTLCKWFSEMGGITQRPWTPTKRRGPIAAEFSGNLKHQHVVVEDAKSPAWVLSFLSHLSHANVEHVRNATTNKSSWPFCILNDDTSSYGEIITSLLALLIKYVWY